MYIIVGLGNPGRDYQNTRHNMGFLTIDVISHTTEIDVEKNKFSAIIGEGYIDTQKVILAKPQTYMNLSGQSVSAIMNFYKLPHENLIVIYDDIDLSLGCIRIRKGGSAGTHNGMRSIIYDLGYDDFTRIRIGLGRPTTHGEGDLASFVLRVPPLEEQKILLEAIKNAAKATQLIVKGQLDKAQAEFNTHKKSEEQ